MSKERHFSSGKEVRNDNFIETSLPSKSNRLSLPGIFQSSRDCLCTENETNSGRTSSVASSEIFKDDVNQNIEMPVSSNRSSRCATRSVRSSPMDSYLTCDGGFKRRSRRDVQTVQIKYFKSSYLLFNCHFRVHLIARALND